MAVQIHFPQYNTWVDVLRLDQTSFEKMSTIKRSDELYFNAKEFHVMETDLDNFAVRFFGEMAAIEAGRAKEALRDVNGR